MRPRHGLGVTAMKYTRSGYALEHYELVDLRSKSCPTCSCR